MFHYVLSSLLPWQSVGRSNFDKGLHSLITLIEKRHKIIIKVELLYIYINIYVYIYMHVYIYVCIHIFIHIITQNNDHCLVGGKHNLKLAILSDESMSDSETFLDVPCEIAK